MRGTFLETSVLWDAASAPTVTADIDTVRTVPTLNSAVLGSIAGGTYFGAPGMFFTLGEHRFRRGAALPAHRRRRRDVQIPPNTVPVEVTSLGTSDWVSVFRLDNPLASGGEIVKDEYTGHATNNNAGWHHLRGDHFDQFGGSTRRGDRSSASPPTWRSTTGTTRGPVRRSR